MREMTIFSSFIFVNMIVDQVNWNVDKLILGRVSGTVSVTIYGLAAQPKTYYISLSTAISNAFIPRRNMLVENVKNNFLLDELFSKVGRIQFMLLSLICKRVF